LTNAGKMEVLEMRFLTYGVYQAIIRFF